MRKKTKKWRRGLLNHCSNTKLDFWITWHKIKQWPKHLPCKSSTKQIFYIPQKGNTYKINNSRENKYFIIATLMINGLDNDKCQHPMWWDGMI